VKTREYGVLFSLALIWGASFFFIKVAVEEVAPVTLVAGRLFFSVVVLASVALAQPALFKGWRRFVGLSVAVAVINYLIPYFGFAWGETRITSGMASILNATTPLWTVLVASQWPGVNREPLTARRGLGVGVGFVGVAVLVGPGVLSLGGNGAGVLVGFLVVLVAAVAYAFGALLARGYAGSAPLVGPLGSQAAALILVAPLALVWGIPSHMPSWRAIGAIVTLGALGTGVAYLLYFWLIRHVGATRTTLVTYLLPCTALIWGALLLSEPVTWNAIAGLALVLVGTMVTNGTLDGLLFRRRRAKVEMAVELPIPPEVEAVESDVPAE
jgi:drug/metabolite transporter (DMT)-like permease